jgi:formylmethanofuran dehydrogenase subunit E
MIKKCDICGKKRRSADIYLIQGKFLCVYCKQEVGYIA